MSSVDHMKLGDAVLIVAHTEGSRATMRGRSLIEVLRAATYAPTIRVLVTNVHAGDALLAICVERSVLCEDDAKTVARIAEETVADRVFELAASVTMASLVTDTHRLELIAAYERKVIGDLVSSVVGRSSDVARNRWSDQKTRLQNLCRATGARPFLIVEGYIQGADRRWSGHMNDLGVQTLLAHTQFRDGISVLQADTTDDTALQLLLDAKYTCTERLRAGGWTRLGEPGSREAFVVRKRDRDTPESWFRGALGMVMRMNEEKAAAIEHVYASPRALQRAYADEPNARKRDTLLAKIRFTAKRSRKEGNIGPAISLSVRQRFYPDEEPSDEEPSPADAASSTTTVKRKLVYVSNSDDSEFSLTDRIESDDEFSFN